MPFSCCVSVWIALRMSALAAIARVGILKVLAGTLVASQLTVWEAQSTALRYHSYTICVSVSISADRRVLF